MVSISQIGRGVSNVWHRAFPQMPTTFLPTIAPAVGLTVSNISPRRCQQMLKLPAFRQVMDLTAEFGYQGVYLSGGKYPSEGDAIGFSLVKLSGNDFANFFIPAHLSGEELNSSWAKLLSEGSDFRQRLFERSINLRTTNPLIFCRGFSDDEIGRIKTMVEDIKPVVLQQCGQLDQVFLIPGSRALSRVVLVGERQKKVLYCFLDRNDVAQHNAFSMAVLISLSNMVDA